MVQFPATNKSPEVEFRVNPPDAIFKLPANPIVAVDILTVVAFWIVTLNGTPKPAVALLKVHSLLELTAPF